MGAEAKVIDFVGNFCPSGVAHLLQLCLDMHVACDLEAFSEAFCSSLAKKQPAFESFLLPQEARRQAASFCRRPDLSLAFELLP